MFSTEVVRQNRCADEGLGGSTALISARGQAAMLLQLREWLPDMGAFGLSYGVEMRPGLAAWVQGMTAKAPSEVIQPRRPALTSAVVSGVGDYFTGQYFRLGPGAEPASSPPAGSRRPGPPSAASAAPYPPRCNSGEAWRRARPGCSRWLIHLFFQWARRRAGGRGCWWNLPAPAADGRAVPAAGAQSTRVLPAHAHPVQMAQVRR